MGEQLKARGFQCTFEGSADCIGLLSSFCGDWNLDISLIMYALSIMGVSKNRSANF